MVIHREPPKHYLGYRVAGKVPVILIPGILFKWGFMKHLGDKISLQGHPVYIVPELGYNMRNVKTAAKTLRSIVVHIVPGRGHIPPKVLKGAKIIRELIEKENFKGAVLVAHSKGGLIGKYLLVHNNTDHRVLGMVAIATPFSGSKFAKFIPHESFKEMNIDSEVIHELEKHQRINKKIISVFPEFDNHVWAENGSFLEGGENIEVPTKGHHRVLFSKKVEEVIVESVEKITSWT